MTLRPDMALSNLIVYPESDRIMYINDPARGKIPMWKHTNDGWKLNVYNASEDPASPAYYLGNGVVRTGTFETNSMQYTFNMDSATDQLNNTYAWDPELEVYKRHVGQQGLDYIYLYVKRMEIRLLLYTGSDLNSMVPGVVVTEA